MLQRHMIEKNKCQRNKISTAIKNMDEVTPIQFSSLYSYWQEKQCRKLLQCDIYPLRHNNDNKNKKYCIPHIQHESTFHKETQFPWMHVELQARKSNFQDQELLCVREAMAEASFSFFHLEQEKEHYQHYLSAPAY